VRNHKERGVADAQVEADWILKARSWRDYYTPKTRDIVAEWYAREIAAFGYTF
jgi:hypothetical protein